jgi:pentatricopeptide repeat protein
VRATELHGSNLACPEQLVVDTAVFAGTTNDTVQIADISLELGVPLHLIKELVQRGPVRVTNSYIRSIWRMHDEEEVVPNTLPNRCLMNCFIDGLGVGSHLWANNSTTADHDRVDLRLLWWLKNHTSFQRFGSWDHFITLGHIFINLKPLIHSQSTIKHILAIIASISNAQALIFTTSMIWVLCKAGKLREAEELFDQIETEGVVPCAYAYNTILMAFITGGYAAMERITQWNLAFTEHSEQGDGYMELAQRVASVGLVGTDIVTSLVVIGSRITAGAGLVTSGLGPSGIAARAGLVTSGMGPVSSGQVNVSVFIWDPAVMRRTVWGQTVFQRLGNVNPATQEAAVLITDDKDGDSRGSAEASN